MRFLVSGVPAIKRQVQSLSITTSHEDSGAVLASPKEPTGKPKVSIIILTLNGAALLERLFLSFQAHNTWDHLEVLVVNHGKDIETQRCLDEWSGRLPLKEIRLLENYSFSYSCNRAAEVASGDVLLFLNNDVEFEQDLLSRMCAALECHGGLVGLKLYHPDKEPGTRGAHHHIGVRFRWNIKQSWLPPFNAVPEFGDETYERQPTRMPAVTAAIVACERQVFLGLGGFHEGFLYAYEDVDLCLKFRLGLGANVVSLNDVSAIHGEGATRMKRATSKRRRVWHAHNSAIFKQRFGALVRRDFHNGLFGGDQAAWCRKPIVAVADIKGSVYASLRKALKTGGAWAVNNHVPGMRRYNLFGVDALICTTPEFSLARTRHRHASI